MVDDDVYCGQVHHLNSGFSQNSSSVRLAPVIPPDTPEPTISPTFFINSDGEMKLWEQKNEIPPAHFKVLATNNHYILYDIVAKNPYFYMICVQYFETMPKYQNKTKIVILPFSLEILQQWTVFRNQDKIVVDRICSVLNDANSQSPSFGKQIKTQIECLQHSYQYPAIGYVDTQSGVKKSARDYNMEVQDDHHACVDSVLCGQPEPTQINYRAICPVFDSEGHNIYWNNVDNVEDKEHPNERIVSPWFKENATWWNDHFSVGTDWKYTIDTTRQGDIKRDKIVIYDTRDDADAAAARADATQIEFYIMSSNEDANLDLLILPLESSVTDPEVYLPSLNVLLFKNTLEFYDLKAYEVDENNELLHMYGNNTKFTVRRDQTKPAQYDNIIATDTPFTDINVEKCTIESRFAIKVDDDKDTIYHFQNLGVKTSLTKEDYENKLNWKYFGEKSEQTTKTEQLMYKWTSVDMSQLTAKDLRRKMCFLRNGADCRFKTKNMKWITNPYDAFYGVSRSLPDPNYLNVTADEVMENILYSCLMPSDFIDINREHEYICRFPPCFYISTSIVDTDLTLLVDEVFLPRSTPNTYVGVSNEIIKINSTDLDTEIPSTPAISVKESFIRKYMKTETLPGKDDLKYPEFTGDLNANWLYAHKFTYGDQKPALFGSYYVCIPIHQMEPKQIDKVNDETVRITYDIKPNTESFVWHRPANKHENIHFVNPPTHFALFPMGDKVAIRYLSRENIFDHYLDNNAKILGNKLKFEKSPSDEQESVGETFFEIEGEIPAGLQKKELSQIKSIEDIEDKPGFIKVSVKPDKSAENLIIRNRNYYGDIVDEKMLKEGAEQPGDGIYMLADIYDVTVTENESADSLNILTDKNMSRVFEIASLDKKFCYKVGDKFYYFNLRKEYTITVAEAEKSSKTFLTSSNKTNVVLPYDDKFVVLFKDKIATSDLVDYNSKWFFDKQLLSNPLYNDISVLEKAIQRVDDSDTIDEVKQSFDKFESLLSQSMPQLFLYAYEETMKLCLNVNVAKVELNKKGQGLFWKVESSTRTNGDMKKAVVKKHMELLVFGDFLKEKCQNKKEDGATFTVFKEDIEKDPTIDNEEVHIVNNYIMYMQDDKPVTNMITSCPSTICPILDSDDFERKVRIYESSTFLKDDDKLDPKFRLQVIGVNHIFRPMTKKEVLLYAFDQLSKWGNRSEKFVRLDVDDDENLIIVPKKTYQKYAEISGHLDAIRLYMDKSLAEKSEKREKNQNFLFELRSPTTLLGVSVLSKASIRHVQRTQVPVNDAWKMVFSKCVDQVMHGTVRANVQFCEDMMQFSKRRVHHTVVEREIYNLMTRLCESPSMNAVFYSPFHTFQHYDSKFIECDESGTCVGRARNSLFCGVSWDSQKDRQEMFYNSMNETKLLMLDGNTPAEIGSKYITFTTKKQMKVVFPIDSQTSNKEPLTRTPKRTPKPKWTPKKSSPKASPEKPSWPYHFTKFSLIPQKQAYKMNYVSVNEITITFDTRIYCNLDLFATRPHSLNFETVDAKDGAKDGAEDGAEDGVKDETILFENEIAKYDTVEL